MRSPRSVTIAPIDWPWRSLKFAMDLRAFVTTGFWPVMAASCSTEASMILPLLMASPSPMLTTIFSSFGACIGFVNPSSFISSARTSFSYRSFRRAAIVLSLPSAGPCCVPGDACSCVYFAAFRFSARAFSFAPSSRSIFSRRTALSPADHHHVRDGDRARPSRGSRPPASPGCGPSSVWRFTVMSFSTRTRPFSRRTSRTLPSCPSPCRR